VVSTSEMNSTRAGKRLMILRKIEWLLQH